MSSPLSASSRSLNELRALLLEANRHSPGPERDLSREVHKAEWRLKEQKLKDDIKGLREKLVVLVRASKTTPPGFGWGFWRGSVLFREDFSASPLLQVMRLAVITSELLTGASMPLPVSCGLA